MSEIHQQIIPMHRASRDARWLPEPALLRVEEASRYLALGRTKTYELVAQGEIPSIRFGRSLRIPREALRAWLDAQLREANLAPTTRSGDHSVEPKELSLA